MKHRITFLMALLLTVVGLNAQIISQYVETNSGSTPKGIEIWNNTGSTLDFATNNLVIKKGTNGAAPSDDFTLSTGTLAAGAVIVIGTSDMEATATGNGAAFETKSFTFNGDDALEVWYGASKTDIFGNPGSDPGSAWDGNGVSTRNQNITLLAGISTGAATGWTDPSTRFETTSTNPSGAGGIDGFGIAPASVGSPAISATPGTITGLDYNTISGGPSASQSFDVSGSNLTDDITVTPPTNFEISTDNSSFQTTALVLTEASGEVASTTIYVRLVTSLSAGDYNGNITCASAGATQQDVAVSGSVIAPQSATLPYSQTFDSDFGDFIAYSVVGAQE